jgi:hypothetical protein
MWLLLLLLQLSLLLSLLLLSLNERYEETVAAYSHVNETNEKLSSALLLDGVLCAVGAVVVVVVVIIGNWYDRDRCH